MASKKAGAYEGVKWAPIADGRCTRHPQVRVRFGRDVCIECHHEQLRAAGVDMSVLAAAGPPLPPAPPEWSQPYDPDLHGRPGG